MSVAELRKALQLKSIYFGTKETMKNLRNGKVNKIFLANNCPEKIKNDLEHYSKISKIKVIELNQPGDELALICKKGYPLTVISCYDEKI